MIWKAIGNLQRIAEFPLSTNDRPNSSQYATTTPRMFRVNSMAMNWPLEVCSAVSVALDEKRVRCELYFEETIYLPNWDDGVKNTSTDAIDSTSADHPVMVHGRALQARSHDSPNGAQSDGLDSADLVANPSTQETSEKSSQIVDRDDTALQQAVRDYRLLGDRIDVAETH